MKRILILTLSFLIFPLITFAAEPKVKISSITLIEKTNEKTETIKPTYKDLKLEFDLRFIDVGDEETYKIVLKNEDNVDYKISDKTEFKNSDYIKYEHSIGDNTLEANSEKEILLTIKYNKEVSEEELIDNIYNETNNLSLILVSKDNPKINPRTADGIMIYLFLLAVSIIFIVELKKSNDKRGIFTPILVLLLLSIPLTINALTEEEIDINTKVEITHVQAETEED